MEKENVGKYFVLRGKVKRGKFSEKENIWKREIFGEGKGGKYLVKENILIGIIIEEGK